jgi:hypothetical protein
MVDRATMVLYAATTVTNVTIPARTAFAATAILTAPPGVLANPSAVAVCALHLRQLLQPLHCQAAQAHAALLTTSAAAAAALLVILAALAVIAITAALNITAQPAIAAAAVCASPTGPTAIRTAPAGALTAAVQQQLLQRPRRHCQAVVQDAMI